MLQCLLLTVPEIGVCVCVCVFMGGYYCEPYFMV